MNILFSPVSLLNIHQVTTVNGNICYEIRTDDCPVRYVFALQSTTFIAIKHDDVIHIFNLKQDRDFPDEFQGYIEQIRGKIYKFFEDSIVIGDYIRLWHEINDNSHNFAIIRQNTSSSHRCEPFIDLSNAKSIIHQLNAALQPTCPGFHLHIDYITTFPRDSNVFLYSKIHLNTYFQPQIILCLFTGNDCVSSITIDFTHPTIMTIDSKTNERYEGRKFNRLLRAVAIIISTHLNARVESISSNATNIISAVLMIKYFNAVSGGGLSKFTVSPNALEKTIRQSFEREDGMETSVELNRENIGRFS